jgi:hypothetical protein
VLIHLGPLLQITPPRLEPIDPRRERVPVSADLVDAKIRAPAIVHNEFERCFVPFLFRFAAEQKHTGNHFMAVGKNVGFDNYPLAADTLRSKGPAVDLRRDVFDDDPASPVRWCHVEHRLHGAVPRGRSIPPKLAPDTAKPQEND